MTKPLVLIGTRISEEPPAQVGVFPYLRLVSGRLTVGGSGSSYLKLSNGRIVQYSIGGGNTYVDDDYIDDDYFE